jgi:hypothetical protein
MARKPRPLALTRATASRRQIAPRILIVCEGKTEKNYLDGFRKYFRLTYLRITCIGEAGEPSALWRKTKDLWEKDKSENEKDERYSAIYCVLDRDEHHQFTQVVEQISKAGQPFQSIISVPCIEFWLLLHFQDYQSPLLRVGDDSPCKVVLRKLVQFLPHYDKNDGDIFARVTQTHPDRTLSQAIARASRMTSSDLEIVMPSPSTEMGRLLVSLRPELA